MEEKIIAVNGYQCPGFQSDRGSSVPVNTIGLYPVEITTYEDGTKSIRCIKYNSCGECIAGTNPIGCIFTLSEWLKQL
ncbi:MAG: hypothetical protein HZB67_02705 [Candidatus Aenigmarchaeota archaeon]|nr:hypothetical protein [Candidatus Aenigmarchaeota archaeon]